MTGDPFLDKLAKLTRHGGLRLAGAASTVCDTLEVAQLAVASRGLDAETYLLPVFQAMFDLYMARSDAAVDQDGEDAYEEPVTRTTA